MQLIMKEIVTASILFAIPIFFIYKSIRGGDKPSSIYPPLVRQYDTPPKRVVFFVLLGEYLSL